MLIRGGLFGRQETLHCLQDVAIKDTGGESLCLGYKTSGYFFFAGVYLTDDGYVLKDKNANLYYPLTEADLKEYQAVSELPVQLPRYDIATADYLFGYSLWLLIGVFALYGFVKNKVTA